MNRVPDGASVQISLQHTREQRLQTPQSTTPECTRDRRVSSETMVGTMRGREKLANSRHEGHKIVGYNTYMGSSEQQHRQ